MGSREMEKPAKETSDSAKETTTSQDQSPGNTMGVVPPDWTGFQAYSPMPPHGYLASSPQPHPYIWGVQHHMPPYGTAPHPYVAMYPHGGLYPHPSMPPGSYPFNPYAMPSPNGVAEASGNTPGSIEANGKSPEGKEKLPIKRSKGSLGSLNMITSANGSYPKSGGSRSDRSSEESDTNSENNSQTKSVSRQDSIEGEGSQNGNTVNGFQNGGLVNRTVSTLPAPAVAGPTTNLNMGVVAAGSRENMQPQVRLQDERELKRQKRKQSNRESARRSRLRKQAECDELGQRAEVLKEENASLKAEVSRIRSDYEQLLSENTALKERLGEVPVQEEEKQQMSSEYPQDA